MGLTNNRPYAMNAATALSTRLMGTKSHSARTMYNTAARTMTSVRQKAANGVSFG